MPLLLTRMVPQSVSFSGSFPSRFNSATVDVSEIRVEDTADFALKLFSTVNLMRKNNKAGTYVSGHISLRSRLTTRTAVCTVR